MKDAYWIGEASETRLAIVPRPRGGDWLEDDLRILKRAGIEVLVSMLTTEEQAELGLEREREIAEQLGLSFHSYPIPDRSTPSDITAFTAFIGRLVKADESGKTIGAHCRGSIGRATIVTASILITRGWTAERALTEIESARGCSVPDTPQQRSWIKAFVRLEA